MLPDDYLAEVGAALTRNELDTIEIVDRRHHNLIKRRFDGKGPLRFVLYARANGLTISCFYGEHVAADFIQLCRFLRNYFVSSLQLYANVYDDMTKLSELHAVKGTCVVDHAELRYGRSLNSWC